MHTYKLTIKKSNERVLALLKLIRSIEEVELKEEDVIIPQWQKEEVLKRKEYLDQHPESTIDFDNMVAELKAKYDL
jgi:hypothetical protein